MAIPDLQKYSEQKPKGLVTIQKIDANDFAIGVKKFNPDDGTELSQTVTGVTVGEIDDKVAELQAQIDELVAFKTDLQETK